MSDANDQNTFEPVMNDLPFEAPYNRLLPEMRALAPDQLMQVNLDITSSVATVLGCLPEIQQFVPQIVEELPKYDVERVKRLEDYTMAVSHAQTMYTLAREPESAVAPLVEQGIKLRERMVLDAGVFANRGLVNGNALKELKGPVGYKNVAVDLQLLAGLFRGSFDVLIANGWAIKREELQRAEAIAVAILRTWS
jgi:hypothetical protein